MRLTNDIREDIFRALLTVSPLMERAKEVVSRRAELVEDIRQELLYLAGTTDDNITAFIDDVKNTDHFRTHFCSAKVQISTGALNFKIKGEYRSMHQNGTTSEYISEFGLRHLTNSAFMFGQSVAKSDCKKYVPNDYENLTGDRVDDLYDRLCSSDVESEALFKDFVGYKLRVMAALNAVTTDTALVKAWPEVKPFIPKAIKQTKTEVALSLSSLNAICGIPKQEK